MVGKPFGRLVVQSPAPDHITAGGNRVKRWICLCECGQTKTVRQDGLRSGATQSCGCLRNDRVKEACTVHGERTKHGHASPEYGSWRQMLTRCNNPNIKNWDDYGGRGITVCKRWAESYPAFLEDMGRRPSPNHSLDRYPNPDGNYEPGNCRWADDYQQSQNRRNNINVLVDGETVCLKEACRRTGVPYKAAIQRRRRGWPQERWLEPVPC